QSQRLSERDLRLIAGSKGQHHLLALAHRARLSQRITDLLIARGDHAVLSALVRNRGARFSIAGCRRLHQRTHTDNALAAELATRSEEQADEHSHNGGQTEGYRHTRDSTLDE